MPTDDNTGRINPPGDIREENIDHGTAKTRAVKGAASLLTRQIIIRVLGLVGILVLARILTPEVFGIFAIIHFIVIFFEEFSTIGLGPALIRKKDKVTETELRTVFSIQLAIVLSSVTLIFFAAPYITEHYDIDDDNTALIRIMAVALLVSSLKTIPSIVLQRNLRHDLLAISQVVQYVVYLVVAITLATLDYGVAALVVATLLRTATGTLMVNCLSWWRPALGVDLRIARELMRFAIPMQLSSIVNLVQNAIIPVVIGSLMGAAAVGIVNFSRSLLESLVNQPLQQLGRIQFRLFSRVQDNREVMTGNLEKAIFMGSLLVFPLLSTFVALVEPFINIVVSSKWAPAIPLIYLLGTGYVSLAVVVPCMQALRALGDAWTPLKVLFVRAVITMLVTLLLYQRLGILAFALGATAAIPISAVIGIGKLRRDLPLALLPQALPPLIASAASGVIVYSAYRLVGSVSGFVFALLLSPVVNLLLLGLIHGEKAGQSIESLLKRLAPGSRSVDLFARKLGSLLRRLDVRRRAAN